MGRHSSPASWPFVRSVVAWAVPWGLAAVVVGAALWVSVTMIAGGPDTVAPRSAGSPSPTRNAAATPTPTPSEPDTVAGKDSEEKSSKKASEKSAGGPGSEDPEVSFAGVTVQVLNGTGGVAGAAERMADRLARLGLEVIAVDNAFGNYSRTTVYWTAEESRAQAQALAAQNGWAAEPKRPRLSPTVDLHIIVGLDEA